MHYFCSKQVCSDFSHQYCCIRDFASRCHLTCHVFPACSEDFKVAFGILLRACPFPRVLICGSISICMCLIHFLFCVAVPLHLFYGGECVIYLICYFMWMGLFCRGFFSNSRFNSTSEDLLFFKSTKG